MNANGVWQVGHIQGRTLARLAYGRFGEGTGSPGVPNYGDCLVYGMALSLREPLLFKGGDFRETDVTAVAY
jgi:ribonuclease VapC